MSEHLLMEERGIGPRGRRKYVERREAEEAGMGKREEEVETFFLVLKYCRRLE